MLNVMLAVLILIATLSISISVGNYGMRKKGWSMGTRMIVEIVILMTLSTMTPPQYKLPFGAGLIVILAFVFFRQKAVNDFRTIFSALFKKNRK
jgi:hypothetical protein